MKFPKQFLTVVLNESLSSAYPVADVWKTTLFLRQTGVMNRGLSFQEFKIPWNHFMIFLVIVSSSTSWYSISVF